MITPQASQLAGRPITESMFTLLLFMHNKMDRGLAISDIMLYWFLQKKDHAGMDTSLFLSVNWQLILKLFMHFVNIYSLPTISQ